MSSIGFDSEFLKNLQYMPISPLLAYLLRHRVQDGLDGLGVEHRHGGARWSSSSGFKLNLPLNAILEHLALL